MRHFIAAAVVIIAIGALGASSQAGAATSSAYISDFQVDYQLGRDNEGRSTLEVTERITAVFPANKNKGLVREIPHRYDGHSVSFNLESVKRNAKVEPIYSQSRQGQYEVIETGTDDYINGSQVFELKYSMRDVTRYFDNTQRDEFYWDINGTGWRVPIQRLSMNLEVDEGLKGQLSGQAACYQGKQWSTESCDVIETPNGFQASASNLKPGQGMTVAIGFSAGTFAEYQKSLIEKLLPIWQIAVVVSSVLGAGVLSWVALRATRWKYRTAEIGTVVPQYLPPKNTSLAAASAVRAGQQATMAAELIDLAVRRYIQILETRPRSMWRLAEYDIKVIRDISKLQTEEREVLSDMFGRVPKVGHRLDLKSLRNSKTAFMRFSDNDKKLRNLVRNQYGLEVVDQAKRDWLTRVAKIFFVGAVLTLNPFLLIFGGVVLIVGKTLWILSDEGLNLQTYLMGLEMYIKTAEKDRLAMLQSPDGAQKIDIKDPTDPAQLVRLYERLLPYAILFGQEKSGASS